jgi:SAM-dependent methyltransferase
MQFDDSTEKLSTHYHGIADYHQDFRNANLFHVVGNYITGKTVLDAGCGSGNFLHSISSDLDKFGIEPNANLREAALAANPDANIKEGFVEQLGNLFANHFDNIVMIDVLEHVQRDDFVLDVLRDKLSENGQLVIIVPAYQYLYGSRDIEVGHFRRYNKKALGDVLWRAGYQIESLRYWNLAGLIPYWISEKILRKSLETKLRSRDNLNIIQKAVSSLLHTWFRLVENKISFGLGLSIICTAKPYKKESKDILETLD